MPNKVSISTLPFKFEELPSISMVLKNYGVDFLHCDIMDGNFVENKTYTPQMLAELAEKINLPLDIHLMVNNPIQYIDILHKYAYFLTIHYEAFKDETELKNALIYMKNQNLKVGISIDLNTDVNEINTVLDIVDLVLVMSVKAGAGGQKFNSCAVNKIIELSNLRKDNNYKYLIEIDGGINNTNVEQCINAGADIIVSGSYVANANNTELAVQSLKK